MLNRAIVFAVQAHQNQYDKAGQPYILHPLKVMDLLNTPDEELRCIALLHDVIEDTAYTGRDLAAAGMSERVINGVMSLTRWKGQDYDDYKRQVKSNIDAIRVKMADLTHNSDIRRLKGVQPKDLQRQAKYQEFYWELCHVLSTSL